MRPRSGSVVLVLPALLTPITTYLGALTVAAWWARRSGRHITPARDIPTTRIAFLVPAHDEERLIADTVTSMMDVDYPDGLARVYVVADHCGDRTVELARTAGATVLEHVDPEPAGKGAALQWAIDSEILAGDEFDAVVVVDADTIVSRNLLRVIDARIADGAQVVQAHYAVRDAEISQHTALRSAALALRHYVRPLGRTALGCSSGLYGNGMAFTRDVLLAHRWTGHLTEDLEFQNELALAGVVVDFAADATVLAEMPTEISGAQSQNERWERGRIETARTYVPRLLRAARGAPGRRRRVLLDTAVDHLVPPLSVLALATVAATTTTAASALVRPTPARRIAARTMVGASAVLAAHVIAGLRMVGAPPAVYRALLSAPRSVLWKCVLWGRMLVGRGGIEWTRTERNPAEAGLNAR